MISIYIILTRKEENGETEEEMESSDFASHITPLMLACINNDYGIVRLLLEKRCKLKEISAIDRSGTFTCLD